MTSFLAFQDMGAGDAEKVDEAFGEAAVLHLLQEIGHPVPPDQSLKKLISQILVATTSSPVRNAAALALADLDAKDETAALLNVISRPELADQCGTPLFALSELGGSLPLASLVALVEHGSFEAKAEALIFAEEGRVLRPESSEEDARLRRRLDDLAKAEDDDAAKAAAFAIRLFEAGADPRAE